MTRPGKNPFQPGRGVLPPLLAGRDEELALAEQRLARLADGASPPRDLLFYGPRGNGKTTLLLEIERRALARDFRVVGLPVDTLTARGELVSELQRRTGESARQLTGGQVMGFGITTTAEAATRNITEMFTDWAAADPIRPLVIILDEAQNLEPEVARPFFDAVQRAKSQAPFLILAAGTPDAPRRIRQAVTSNERGFKKLRVGRLSRSDTIAALRVPPRESGRPITEGAAAFLAEESQDYPYFIQLLGSAAWEAATAGAEILLQHAKRGAAACAADIEDIYEERYREAEARRVESVLRPLARLFAEQDGRLSDSQLMPLLRRSTGDEVPFDAIGLRNELSDLGVLWTVRAGVWEMGIPSFADYLLRRA